MPSSLKLAANQALSRAAGAPLVPGNHVTLLRDAREHYPAWLEAIAGATRWIHLESYIIRSDRTGRMFAEALAERAGAGVRVRVLCDWLGGFGKTWPRFWRRLRRAGVDVRLFNPPRLASPIEWLARDHRKMLAVDGRLAFVTGLCIGDQWTGDPERGLDPWRDTGVAIAGPAVADVEAAFAEAWAAAGAALPADERVAAESLAAAGDVALRVIASQPSRGNVLRLDQLVTAMAERTLWITDAYFVGMSAYIEGLLNAAHDGVDVRLLVPGSGSDIAAVQRLTRAGYRTLLEGGVRVFEWNGSMMHAKTAVADGRWARVGSTNLNLQSWLGNWELDVAVEDDGFGAEMAAMYERDLEHCTEIVLDRRRVAPAAPAAPAVRRRRRRGGGSTSRAAAGALRLGNSIGAVLTARREVGPAEAQTLLWGGMLAAVVAAVAALWPRVAAWPLAALAAWLGVAWIVRAARLYRRGARDRASTRHG